MFECCVRKDDEKSDINLQYVWTVVKGKLLDSLEVIENGTDSGNRFLKSQSSQARRPLSLYAVSEGPMMRLLWASFQQLEKEVGGLCIWESLHSWHS